MAANGSGKALDSLKNLFKPSSCFVAGTLIHTIDGLKPIEDIEVGDLVASKNDQTGETDFKPVVQLFRHEDKTVLNLTLETQDGQEEFIQATPEHPFMLENGQWKNAGYLLPGDTVQTHKDRMAKVKSIATDSKRHKVYNFEVADYHTYFVGETGIWVHNDCGDIKQKSFAEQMSPEDAKRYNERYNKRAPETSSPYNTHTRYHENGDIKQVTTYDQYGDRHRQFDLNDSRGRDAHQHKYEYSQQNTRPRGYRTKGHDKIDE